VARRSERILASSPDKVVAKSVFFSRRNKWLERPIGLCVQWSQAENLKSRMGKHAPYLAPTQSRLFDVVSSGRGGRRRACAAGTSSALIRPVHVPVDGGGVPA
jgi:hypothetical protein